MSEGSPGARRFPEAGPSTRWLFLHSSWRGRSGPSLGEPSQAERAHLGADELSDPRFPERHHHVTVDQDLALADRAQVRDRAEGAPDQPLNLVGAPARVPAIHLTLNALRGGAREHAVLRGHPAPAAVPEERGDALLDGGCAE